jgi:hypothetical protein
MMLDFLNKTRFSVCGSGAGWERGEERDRGRRRGRGGREKDEKCEYVSLIPRTEIVLNSLNSMYLC